MYGVKLLIHYETSTVQPSKFVNNYVIPFRIFHAIQFLNNGPPCVLFTASQPAKIPLLQLK